MFRRLPALAPIGALAATALLLLAAHAGSATATVAWGDIDCSGTVTIGDAQKIARNLIDLPITQSDSCPALNDSVEVDGTTRLWGDIDCNGNRGIGDAQKLARNLIALEITIGLGCPSTTQLVTLGPTSQPTTPPPALSCGEERWSVKTLSDPDADSVNFGPEGTTVDSLSSLSRPTSLPANGRIAPTELTVFRITALAEQMKLEDDRDIHLVVGDPSDSTHTMIVEFPDPACAGAISSAEAGVMMQARQDFIAMFGEPSSSHFASISGTVVLTGVGFFDFLHGQTGVAPNGIELHPVLSIEGAPGPTTPAPGPTTPAPLACHTEAPANPWGYDFCTPGNSISSPPADFCSYFPCITTFANGHGYVIECTDGKYSKSGGVSGACSGHGGAHRTLYSH